MSRRHRRKEAHKQKVKSTWLMRGILAIGISFVVIALGGYFWLRSYLSGKEFRDQLTKEASNALDAPVTISPLRWDGFRLMVDDISANSEGSLSDLKIHNLKTGIEPSAVINGVWSVPASRINRVTATVNTQVKKTERKSSEPTVTKAPAWYERFIPKKYQLESFIVEHSDINVILSSGPLRINGTRWEVLPSDILTQVKATASGGEITTPWKVCPPLRLNDAQIRHQDGTIYLTDSDFSVYESGRLQLNGECSFSPTNYTFDGTLDDVLCSEILSEDWKKRLTGTTAGSFRITGSSGAPQIDGNIAITNGTLTALPVLDKLAAYSQSIRFRVLSLKDASTDFTLQGDDIMRFTNIRLGSEGLCQLEGTITLTKNPLAKNHNLDGDFMLGLAPGTLATIPGAEEKVFSAGKLGLLWTPLRITGTTDDMEEDLSDRLMQAAGERMIEIIPETGLKVLKFTKEVLDEKDLRNIGQSAADTIQDAGKMIDTGKEAINGGKEIIEGVKGVLDILGN